jgi:hypothetical protein
VNRNYETTRKNNIKTIIYNYNEKTFVVKTQFQHHLCTESQVEVGDDYGGGTIQSRGGFWDDEEEEY